MTEANATIVTPPGGPAGTGTSDPAADGGQSGHATPPPAAVVNPGGATDGDLDLAAKGEKVAEAPPPAIQVSQLDTAREGVRGDLARGLLWLLTLLIGGLLVFVGIGRVVPEVLTQSVFPSLVTLTGTALGFYFGSQSNKDSTK